MVVRLQKHTLSKSPLHPRDFSRGRFTKLSVLPGKLRKERKTAGKTAKIMHNTLQKIDKCLRLTYNIHKQVFDKSTTKRVFVYEKEITKHAACCWLGAVPCSLRW